ncbi:MAG: urease accessory protein UreD, partial [Alistipes sp.]|nr:urease accessory protein UreD [Alistipes sp.]
YVDSERRLAGGMTRLPGDCVLLYKVLGDETAPVKALVRQFCSTVRMQVKGCALPDEFPWR